MKWLVSLSLGTVLTTSAYAQTMSAGHDVMTSVPSSSLTVTNWYKQPVYDKSDSKIGDIDDVLVGPNGQIDAVIIGVGGFLGAPRRGRWNGPLGSNKTARRPVGSPTNPTNSQPARHS